MIRYISFFHHKYPTVWSTSNVITAPKINLYNASTIHAVGNTTINGNLNNIDGRVEVDQSKTILITGKPLLFKVLLIWIAGSYLQGHNASFIVGVDSNTRLLAQEAQLDGKIFSHPSLLLILTGQVYYSYSKLKEGKYLIIEAFNNGTISGTFKGKASTLAGNIKSLAVDYSTPHQVYLVYPA